ncbi:uncharacterized protein C8R40DRAFT_1075063 [Lentinula edodes]|uniref:uncharacterized protein n=1 Tax=Lentinula edodes TaxID=5353 RepID=UPI001E8E8CA3|nr:uncharacterized protein C8R40DRAFT_1075063 [Lentinula edodes]KAH7868128.1 hypothetical protein C8R40DRAFT_1075063 [Lentinula edodes]
MVVDISSDRGFNGLLKAVTLDNQSNPADILDDLEESYDTANLDISSSQSSDYLSGLNDAVRDISKGVSEKTAKEYLRCNTISLNGSSIPASVEKSTYTHAQKMQAAATFGFGRIHGLGMQAWHSSEITGKMLGNPSISEITQSGDTPTSARAVTSVLLESLYYYNKQPEFQKPKAYQSTSRSGLKGQLDSTARYNDIQGSQKWTGLRTSLDIKPFVFWEMPEEYQHLCVDWKKDTFFEKYGQMIISQKRMNQW